MASAVADKVDSERSPTPKRRTPSQVNSNSIAKIGDIRNFHWNISKGKFDCLYLNLYIFISCLKLFVIMES